LSLKPGQNIEDFYCLLIEKGQLLSKPEHEIMAQFIKGLPEKLAFYIRASKPNDTTEALTIAKTGEAYNYREHDPTFAAAKVTKPQSDDLADMKLQINHLTDVVKGLTFQCKNRPNENQGPVPKESPNFQQPRRTGACFKCNAQVTQGEIAIGMEKVALVLRVSVSCVHSLDTLRPSAIV